MAHFNFSKDIKEIVKMDGPLQSGPLMRWQRKAPPETLLRVHASDGGVSSPFKSKSKTPGKSVPTTTPGKGKTPKTPGNIGADGFSNVPKSGKKAKTPSAKTPSRMQGDRFIPDRSSTDMEYGHYAVMKRQEEDAQSSAGPDGDNFEYKEQLKDAMDVRERKILNFKTKAPQPKMTDVNNLHVLYSCSKSANRHAAASRHIPREPERVLDAPELMDDYYLNLLDWSKSNMFAVALGGTVFLWNPDNGTITELMELATQDDYFSSLAWVQDGAVLAVGVSTGLVQLWDTEQKKLLRSMTGHAARVGCLSWNQHILSSGSRTGSIHQHDVRVANHQVATLQHHTQEVCGLRWSPDGRHLASGGNDNIVNVWGERNSAGDPLHTFTSHQAAVKAIAWCPWQPYLLATGGGTADRHIRLWNVQSGSNIANTDTESQVCSILWSKEHKELISGHGYSLNHLRIWKYPTMTRVVDLVGHTSRILGMAMSPDGTTVASAAADETIRLWKCFDVKEATKKAQGKEEKTLTSDLQKICLR
ncbi:cell division cycle protein 20 homolog [Aplysia californica]|uniref:Cell division cycle protein 20 homolog n=1 Tax=Aplysia californica TaxID=6500 RepID=A0ABM1AB10_APLCA|nr:cell division cycle protein 20 homolog [Aplysia californica]XP_012944269.1 cell division cycle protein 20 homolog [Aplysia californica]